MDTAHTEKKQDKEGVVALVKQRLKDYFGADFMRVFNPSLDLGKNRMYIYSNKYDRLESHYKEHFYQFCKALWPNRNISVKFFDKKIEKQPNSPHYSNSETKNDERELIFCRKFYSIAHNTFKYKNKVPFFLGSKDKFLKGGRIELRHHNIQDKNDVICDIYITMARSCDFMPNFSNTLDESNKKDFGDQFVRIANVFRLIAQDAVVNSFDSGRKKLFPKEARYRIIFRDIEGVDICFFEFGNTAQQKGRNLIYTEEFIKRAIKDIKSSHNIDSKQKEILETVEQNTKAFNVCVHIETVNENGVDVSKATTFIEFNKLATDSFKEYFKDNQIKFLEMLDLYMKRIYFEKKET